MELEKWTGGSGPMAVIRVWLGGLQCRKLNLIGSNNFGMAASTAPVMYANTPASSYEYCLLS